MKLKIFIILIVISAMVGTILLFFPGGKFPPGVWQCLRSPKQMTLYLIDPERTGTNNPGQLHGHIILGQVDIVSPTTRRTVAKTVRSAVRAWRGETYKCIFSPRHAVRVSNDAGIFDVLICFQCKQIEFYEGDKVIGETGLSGSPESLNEIFRAANVPLPKN